MRVALVSPYSLDSPGGVQDQVIRLRRWLGDQGHDAWIVAPGSGGDWWSAGRVVHLPANRSMAPVALAPGAVRRTLEAVADAEVVHVHEPLMPAVSLGLVLRCRRPLVGTFHADPSPLVRKMYRWGRGPLGRAVRRIQVVTAVSDVAAMAVEGFVRPRIVSNAIDAAAYPADEQRLTHRVVFVGRDEPRKGLETLFRAWSSVARATAELVVISDTDRPAPPGVRIVGRVDEVEKRRLLASAAVLCAPNTGGESFGLVVAEGMAAGCAVVASGLPAFVAVLGDTGILRAPGDAEGFAEAISGLLDDPEEASRLGRAARARAQRFDIGEVGAAYVEAYRDARAAFRDRR